MLFSRKRDSRENQIRRLYHIANSARDRGDWASARPAFKNIVDVNPADAAAWVQYGHALKETGIPGEAEAAYLKAAALMPTDADIQLQLGHLYKIMHRRRASIAAYRAAHALDPSAPDPITELRAYGAGLTMEEDAHSGLFNSQYSGVLEAVQGAANGVASQDVSERAPEVPGRPGAPVARFEDIEFLYQIFLGREREFTVEQDSRVGWSLARAIYEFIRSPEFDHTVNVPMLAAHPPRAPLFEYPPTSDLLNWAASRLPLSHATRLQLPRAHSWYEVHSSIFADPEFADEVLGPDSPFARLGGVPPAPGIEEAIVEASLLFERDWYLERYPDVAASRGDPLQHYLLHGVADGRNPNRLFDTRWYISRYPEVASGAISPLIHYITRGAIRGYDPHPFFSTKDFLCEHPEFADSDFTPLADFLNHIVPADPASFPTFGPYDVHKATMDNWRPLERPELLRHIEAMTVAPTFFILVKSETLGTIESTRAGVSQQIYRKAQLVSSIEQMTKAAQSAGDGPCYLLWLDDGDELAAEALYELAAQINADPDLDLIYFDHEVALDQRRSQPFHKPGWSPDYLESFDYIGAAACFELTKAAKFLPAATSRYDFLLRFTEAAPTVRHIDRVLMRCRNDGRKVSGPEQRASDILAIEGRLQRTWRAGKATANIPGMRSYNIDIRLLRKPLVSVVLPTAGRIISYEGRRVDLIVDCFESIADKMTYSNIEFIVVDNGDFDRSRLKHIDSLRIKYDSYLLPEVNIARKINQGAALASGELFLIFNDDITLLTSDWIERMVAHFEKPHVGLVGAKLLYPNGTIQHAGMVSCDGDPQHVRRFQPRDDIGYAFSTCGVRNYVAVTGAVSMTRKDAFWRVGGYSEELPVDYNDVDYCYKLGKLGYSIVYEPKVELIHYESVSMIRTPRPRDAEYFAEQSAWLANDPFYNEYCLSKHPATFDLAYSVRRY